MKLKLSDPIRHELIVLARRREARVTAFSPDRPTEWRPGQVRNPTGMLDAYFTDASAWELIATKLEEEHPVELVTLRKPQGAKGYVMKIEIEK